jgi:tetratricopeptide (TPR) repeat protein
LFHAQIADALVTRGDDALRVGDVNGAVRSYERAHLLDPASTVASDRLAFRLALLHDPVAARRAIRVATAALTHGPNLALFADRAFGELQLRRFADAEHDFAAAGTMGGDPRYDHLAARAALHCGDRDAAIRLAHRALAADPSFQPARALLRRLE